MIRCALLLVPFVAHANPQVPDTLGSNIAPMNAAFAFDDVDAPFGDIDGRRVSVSTFTDDDGFLFVTADEAIPPDRRASLCARADVCAHLATLEYLDVDPPPPPLVTITVEAPFSDSQRPDRATRVTLEITPAEPDDIGDLVTQYEIVRTIDEPERLPLAPAFDTRVPDAPTSAGRAVYEVRAVDAAGNRSDATAAVVDIGCAETSLAPFGAVLLLLARRRR